MARPLAATYRGRMFLRSPTLAGGTYFFTVDLEDRRSGMLVEHAYRLRATVRRVRDLHPFALHAWVMLPDHLHAVWTLPEADTDAAMRWSLIKRHFGEGIDTLGDTFWQRRYRDRLIASEADLQRHVDYVHANPVRHGYVRLPTDWPYSSIHRQNRPGKHA